jgi:hypothetical protein
MKKVFSIIIISAISFGAHAQVVGMQLRLQSLLVEVG